MSMLGLKRDVCTYDPMRVVNVRDKLISNCTERTFGENAMGLSTGNYETTVTSHTVGDGI